MINVGQRKVPSIAEHVYVRGIVKTVEGYTRTILLGRLPQCYNSRKNLCLSSDICRFSDRLTSFLVTGDAGKKHCYFQMGGVICLGSQAGLWNIEWMLIPSVIQ